MDAPRIHGNSYAQETPRSPFRLAKFERESIANAVQDLEEEKGPAAVPQRPSGATMAPRFIFSGKCPQVPV